MKKIIVAILAVLVVLGIGVSAASIENDSQTEGKLKEFTTTEVNEQAEKKVTVKAKEEIAVENKKEEVKEETVNEETKAEETKAEETKAEETKAEETKAEPVKKENTEQKTATKAKEQKETKVKKEVKAEPVKPKLTNEQVADKVLKGEYGNGDARKAALEKEGYNYAEVQKIVASKAPKPAPVKQASKQTNSNATANSKSQSSAPAASTRTDGFNFKGHHFSLANFSGTGQVPHETNNVYRWTYKPTHYLIERISPAGRVIKQVVVGDTVVVDGQSYTVTRRQGGIHNDGTALDVMAQHASDITFQTCDTTKGPNGLSDLTIWWAVKK